MKKQIISYIFITILLSLTMYSCTEKIDIKTKSGGSYLNIFGYITNEPGQHRIRISKTTPYFSNQRAEVISGAQVTISDGENIFTLTECPDTAGLYLTNADFYGIGGRQYTLDVELDYFGNGNTEHFRAVDFMPKPLHFDTVYISEKTTMDMPNMVLTGSLEEGQQNNLAIYVSQKEEKFYLLDSFINMLYWQFEGIYFEDLMFPFGLEKPIKKGDTIALTIAIMSLDLITYVNNVQAELMGADPIFGGPPVNVETNIVHMNPTSGQINAVGYFGAFSKTTAYVVAERNYK